MNMGIIGKFNVYVFKKFERLYNLKFGGYVNVVLFKGFVGFCVFFCVQFNDYFFGFFFNFDFNFFVVENLNVGIFVVFEFKDQGIFVLVVFFKIDIVYLKCNFQGNFYVCIFSIDRGWEL